MLVSWKWLSQYINVPVSPEELGDRLAMSGLNLESVRHLPSGDVLIDLEITSNRGDCLGHIGVAREAAVLYGLDLHIPAAKPIAIGPPISKSFSVKNDYQEGCSRYTARIIRGVRVGPSPEWIAGALRAVGINAVNNIVDVTNFVMMECGQPLHGFDLQQIQGQRIEIRRPKSGESIEAIDHRTYMLQADDCVIADEKRAIAIAGVMGGAATEVGEATSDLLIEAADFVPLVVRRTARRLRLHSPSSFRFERRVDPHGVDWASRRCCELILKSAGGTLDDGYLETNHVAAIDSPVVLRFSQVKRVLGIDVPEATIRKILLGLGCTERTIDAGLRLSIVPPSWRHDLGREIDLIEEVARINGYEKIPNDMPISVVPSRRRPVDYVLDRVRGVLLGYGFCEAMTPSVVISPTDGLYSPWTNSAALETTTPMLEGARTLRRSLIPSLLQSRCSNQTASGVEANLFETAHIYLPATGIESLPVERMTLGMVSGHDFFAAKGMVQLMLQRIGIKEPLSVGPHEAQLLDSELAVELFLGDRSIGFLGAVSEKQRKTLKLDLPVTVCELDVTRLIERANLVPQHQAISPYPVVSRDINLIVDESIRWSELEQIVQTAVGAELLDLRYVETYRNEQKDGVGKKRVLLNMQLQKSASTLAGAEADALVNAAVLHCENALGAKLLQ